MISHYRSTSPFVSGLMVDHAKFLSSVLCEFDFTRITSLRLYYLPVQISKRGMLKLI